jgi:hypothetical protein
MGKELQVLNYDISIPNNDLQIRVMIGFRIIIQMPYEIYTKKLHN